MEHRYRPDPKEPYRYGCVDCGSPKLYALRSAERPPGKKYPFASRGGSEAREDEGMRYRCDECNARMRSCVDRTSGARTASTPRP